MISSGCYYEVPEIIPDSASFQPANEQTKTRQNQYPTRWITDRDYTIAPGVHVLAERAPSAAYAIETDKGIVLFDTGQFEVCYEMKESLLSLRLRPEDISTILLTHAHYDHVFGANKLREVSGATVMAGREDCETLRRADVDALFSLFPRTPFSGDPIQVDRELVDGERIDLGDVQIEVLATPGHTPGSTCYLVEKDSKRYLISGDVVASLNFGPATYSAKLSPRFRGDAKDYLATINRLLEMEPPDYLLSGHPQQQKRTESIELDVSTWKRVLESARVELETIVDRFQRDGADFLDQTPKSIEPNLYSLGSLDGIAVYCVDDGKQLVVVNAPGGDRFSEFLSNRFSSLKLDDAKPRLVLLTSSSQERCSGLRSLKGMFRVVAPPDLAETLRSDGLDVITAEEIDGLTQSGIEAVILELGTSYLYRVGDRTVLFTPDVPRNIAMTWVDRHTGKKTFADLQPQRDQIVAELSANALLTEAYSESLLRLRRIAPDVWLPLVPFLDQNANLYDDDWTDQLDANRRTVQIAR
ncbi:MAG: MBL fold metallo-hydrolase [Rubripirellula sp.]